MTIKKIVHDILCVLKDFFKINFNKAKILFIKWGGLNTIFKFVRLIIILLLIFGSSLFITKKLTPSEYTIRFKRECDGTKCEKIKERDSTIESEIKNLLSTLEGLDFFTRFTFLRFDFQTTNQSSFNFVVTEPRLEKEVPIEMECYLNNQSYIFSPNSGIIFKQKSSIKDIIEELSKIQDILITCNPATQSITKIVDKPFIVAPNAQIQFIYNEEKYHLKFLPDKWNFHLTILQLFVAIGIIFGAFYEILRFIKKGFK